MRLIGFCLPTYKLTETILRHQKKRTSLEIRALGSKPRFTETQSVTNNSDSSGISICTNEVLAHAVNATRTLVTYSSLRADLFTPLFTSLTP